MEQTKNIKHTKTYSMVLVALFTALTAVCSQISVPIGPVPINLGLLAVFTAGGCLGTARAALSQLIYLLLGAVGVPVFAGFQGGFGVLLGPTGGYAVAYILTAATVGFLVNRFGKRFFVAVPAMALGLLLCYTLGTAWFMVSTGTGLASSLMLCVVPFLIGDACKIALAAFLTVRFKRMV